MLLCVLVLAILVAALPVSVGAAPGVGGGSPAPIKNDTVDITPHRAVYSLDLGASEFGSGIADASGTMAFEWAEGCENWTIQQKAIFNVVSPEGGSVRTEVSFSSWESKDGDRMGFSLRTLQDGEMIEDLRGEASLQAGKGGKAVYRRPEPRTLSLPPGTEFPGAHTILLIRKALAGETTVLLPVFLGQREDEPMTVNSIISRTPVDKPPPEGEWGGAFDGRAWLVHLAYYGTEDTVSPAFEVRQTLYENGIVADATVIYDTFSFVYTLERLETLPVPKC